MSKDLKALIRKLRKFDYCMMGTSTAEGALLSQPMSNNGSVDDDGTTYFFSDSKTAFLKDLKKSKHTVLAYQDGKTFVSVSGPTEITDDKTQLSKHWDKSLKKWFAEGVDTPGLALVVVKPDRIKYWHRKKEFELRLPTAPTSRRASKA